MKENEKVTALLHIKSEQVRTGAEILMKQTRDWQVIKQYLCNRLNDLQLTAVQQNKLMRYQFIYANLSSGKYLKHEVIAMTMRNYDINQRQVYDDITCTQEIFSSVLNINKLFELQNQLEIAKSILRKCIEVNDMDNAAKIQKNILAITAMLPDEETSAGEDFTGHNFEATFDPRLLGSPDIDMHELLTAINAKRKVKINTDMFENISYVQPTDEKADSL